MKRLIVTSGIVDQWEGKVGQSRLTDSWISLQDYFDAGTSHKPTFQPEASVSGPGPSTPSEGWIDAADYYTKGVRVAKRTPEVDQFFVTLKEAAPKPPLPPEAGLSIYDAMKQIYSVYGPRNAVFSHLRKLELQDRRELDSGRIDIREFERRAVATAIIRENHGRRMEKITQWYLDNYFRLFENPEPVEVSDGKLH